MKDALLAQRRGTQKNLISVAAKGKNETKQINKIRKYDSKLEWSTRIEPDRYYL
jgi:hypothetical protein